MTAQALLTIGFFLVVLIAAAYPLAIFVTRIADVSPIRGVAGTVERFLYRLSGVDPQQEACTRGRGTRWRCCSSMRSERSWYLCCSACSSGCP